MLPGRLEKQLAIWNLDLAYDAAFISAARL